MASRDAKEADNAGRTDTGQWQFLPSRAEEHRLAQSLGQIEALQAAILENARQRQQQARQEQREMTARLDETLGLPRRPSVSAGGAGESGSSSRPARRNRSRARSRGSRRRPLTRSGVGTGADTGATDVHNTDILSSTYGGASAAAPAMTAQGTLTQSLSLSQLGLPGLDGEPRAHSAGAISLRGRTVNDGVDGHTADSAVTQARHSPVQHSRADAAWTAVAADAGTDAGAGADAGSASRRASGAALGPVTRMLNEAEALHKLHSTRRGAHGLRADKLAGRYHARERLKAEFEELKQAGLSPREALRRLESMRMTRSGWRHEQEGGGARDSEDEDVGELKGESESAGDKQRNGEGEGQGQGEEQDREPGSNGASHETDTVRHIASTSVERPASSKSPAVPQTPLPVAPPVPLSAVKNSRLLSLRHRVGGQPSLTSSAHKGTVTAFAAAETQAHVQDAAEDAQEEALRALRAQVERDARERARALARRQVRSAAITKMAEHRAQDYLPVLCDWCGEAVIKAELAFHHEEECPSRERPCPNAGRGCPEWVAIQDVESHLRDECTVALRTAELAARAGEARELCACRNGCGARMPRAQLAEHEANLCSNRLVPCCNAPHGCEVMVRVKNRRRHENVDDLERPRPNLQFSGRDSYVLLAGHGNEHDLNPPWTFEAWVWRSEAADAAKLKVEQARRWRQKKADLLKRVPAALASVKAGETKLKEASVALAKAGAKGGREAKLVREEAVKNLIKVAEVRDAVQKELKYVVFKLEQVLLAAEQAIEDAVATTRRKHRRKGKTREEEEVAKTLASFAEAPDGEPMLDLVMEAEGPVPPKAAEALRKKVEAAAKSAQKKREKKAKKAQQKEEKEKEQELKNNEETGTEAENVAASNDDARSDDATAEQSNKQLQQDEQNEQQQQQQQQQTNADIQQDEEQRQLENGGKAEDEGEEEQRPIVALWRAELAAEQAWREEKQAALDALAGKKKKKKDPKKEAEKELKKRIKAEHKKRKKHHHRGHRNKKEIDFTKGAGGQEYLMQSEKWSLKLEVEAERQVVTAEGKVPQKYWSVGFSRLGEADYAFGYEVPRGRWVHLAIVAMAPPKRRVALYADGELVGHVDERCKLPMHYLGGKEQAMQGWMQEVRIWRNARARMDLLDCMHRCLDFRKLLDTEKKADKRKAKQDAKADAADEAGETDYSFHASPDSRPKSRSKKRKATSRLLAYFTFEEGQGNYVADWTDHLPRQRLHNCKWESEHSAGIDERDWNFPPTPSVREQNVCKVALRRLRLAQRARARQEPVTCECGTTVPGNWMHVHKMRCSMRLVHCRNPGCNMKVRADRMEEHEISECKWKKHQRALGVGRRKQLEMVQCPLCGQEVERWKKRAHELDWCPQRLCLCPVPGCGKHVALCDLADHAKNCNSEHGVWSRQARDNARERKGWESYNPQAVAPVHPDDRDDPD